MYKTMQQLRATIPKSSRKKAFGLKILLVYAKKDHSIGFQEKRRFFPAENGEN
jgi:hypothetical protein